MFYDAHFTVDVTNWSRGIWLDGTTQIMDGEDILLSDRLVPVFLREFSAGRRSASEALASIFSGEIIGQIAVGVSGSSVELAPSCLRSSDRSDAVGEAWCWFCGRIREIPDSVIV